MAERSLPLHKPPRREPTSSAPSPQPTINDGTCWHAFVAAAQLVPPCQRGPFTLLVFAYLLDHPNMRPEMVIAACDGALIEMVAAKAVRQ